MAWIEIIGIEKAKGLLRKTLEDAIRRAGRVWNITAVMSMNPRVMKTSMDFYAALMFGRSSLSRGRRELLAVVVSATNKCFY